MLFSVIIDKLNEIIAKAISWLVLILILELVYDTIMRYLFNVAVIWSYDISYMLYGIIFMLAVPYVEKIDKHVRIEILYEKFPFKIKVLLDILGYVLLYLPSAMALLYFGWRFFWESYKLKEVSGASMWAAPIYPFKFIIPLSGALLLFQTISEIIKRIIKLRENQDDR